LLIFEYFCSNSYCVHIFSDEKHDKIWSGICSNWRSLYREDDDFNFVGLQVCVTSTLSVFNFVGLQVCVPSTLSVFKFVYLQLCVPSTLSVFNSVFFKFVASTPSDSTSSSTTLSPTLLLRTMDYTNIKHYGFSFCFCQNGLWVLPMWFLKTSILLKWFCQDDFCHND
jgi:hypothetical protein